MLPTQVALLSKSDVYSMRSQTSKMHKDLALLTIVIITFITEAKILISLPRVEIQIS